MLCQFSVKNFRCIKDEITLDLQATNISEHVQSLLSDVDGEKFLPLSVIYGPNASGKSTVLLALYSLANKIMRPIRITSHESEKRPERNFKALSIEPFKFSEETGNSPTEYELFFRINGCEYQYKISLLKNKVVNEELSRKDLHETEYRTVFMRNGDKISLEILKDYPVPDISDDLALLSYVGITYRKNAVVKDVINWFDKRIYFLNYGNPLSDAEAAIADSDDEKSIVLKMFKEMDIDISDYKVEQLEGEGEKNQVDVYTSHEIDGKEYNLELSDESSGTIKMFGVLPYIAESIRDGITLIIDELDAKLHPLLLNYIIGLFRDPKINKNKAQLIFTSHDLTTMNAETFRRDEIWFIAKGGNGAAKMYSLVEFKDEDGSKERKDAKYSKRYLEGRYGADPYLQRIINWEDYNARQKTAKSQKSEKN